MKKTLLCTALLIAFNATAQEYEWQWAKRGGGKKNAQGENSAYDYNSEQVLDIAIDADNNYYYLTFMTQLDTEYDGTPVTVYNPEMQSSGMADIVLISTDCEGTLRWTQTIGGGQSDYAYNIELDNNGGLYLGANVLNTSNSTDEYLPPHFSPDDAMPVLGSNTGEPQEGYKTAALLKYNTSDGSLAWRVMPQGDVTLALRYASINQVVLDSEGMLHVLLGLNTGTHVDGAVVVPEMESINLKYYILKYNGQGDFIDAVSLPLEGSLLQQHTDFDYDESLQRYYITGFRTNGNINSLYPIFLNGVSLQQAAYVMAFTGTGEVVWSKEFVPLSTPADNRIYSLEMDDDSSFYIAGKYKISPSNPGISFGSFQLPMDLGGNVMFVMKLDSEGEVQWFKVPSGYSSSNGNFTGAHYTFNMVLNGNELVLATQVSNEIWDDVSVNRPPSHLSDPALLRLNKETGEVIALHDIMTTAGTRDGMTAVAVDNDGNYITGGYFYNDLFTLEDDNVPTVTKVGGYQSYTDFFIAKLAASACGSGTAAVQEHGFNDINIYPNPASGLLNISTQESLKHYEVVNMLGQVLLKGNFESGQNSISIENLSVGTYILNLTTTDGRRMSHKIVKE